MDRNNQSPVVRASSSGLSRDSSRPVLTGVEIEKQLAELVANLDRTRASGTLFIGDFQPASRLEARIIKTLGNRRSKLVGMDPNERLQLAKTLSQANSKSLGATPNAVNGLFDKLIRHEAQMELGREALATTAQFERDQARRIAQFGLRHLASVQTLVAGKGHGKRLTTKGEIDIGNAVAFTIRHGFSGDPILGTQQDMETRFSHLPPGERRILQEERSALGASVLRVQRLMGVPVGSGLEAGLVADAREISRGSVDRSAMLELRPSPGVRQVSAPTAGGLSR